MLAGVWECFGMFPCGPVAFEGGPAGFEGRPALFAVGPSGFGTSLGDFSENPLKIPAGIFRSFS